MNETGKTNKKEKRFTRQTLPVKRDINFAVVGIQPMNYKALVPAAAAIVIAAALFSKFAVADRLAALNEAEGQVTAMQSQIDRTFAEIKEYSELEEEYAHYTYSGLTAEEASRADRLEAIDLINTLILPNAEVTNWTISGNQVNLSVTAESLQKLNLISAEIEADDRADFCIVSTAATDDAKISSEVTGQLTIYLTEAGEEDTEQ